MDIYKEAIFPRQQVCCTYESIALETVCLRPTEVQTQKPQHEVPHLGNELMTFDRFWGWENQFSLRRCPLCADYNPRVHIAKNIWATPNDLRVK